VITICCFKNYTRNKVRFRLIAGNIKVTMQIAWNTKTQFLINLTGPHVGKPQKPSDEFKTTFKKVHFIIISECDVCCVMNIN